MWNKLTNKFKLNIETDLKHSFYVGIWRSLVPILVHSLLEWKFVYTSRTLSCLVRSVHPREHSTGRQKTHLNRENAPESNTFNFSLTFWENIFILHSIEIFKQTVSTTSINRVKDKAGRFGLNQNIFEPLYTVCGFKCWWGVW